MAPKPTQHLFCFGLGYSVRHLVATAPTKLWRVSGTVRTEEAKNRFTRYGWSVHLFDGEVPHKNLNFIPPDVTHIIASIPPGKDGDPVVFFHAQHIKTLRNLKWLGYLSTTGVYGDRAGGWVDEDSERKPTGLRGRLRVNAEDAWLKLWAENGIPIHLFRLAGIYGPSRNAIENVRQGRAHRIVKTGQVFNRIHVDDIAQIITKSMSSPNPGSAYNLCDDEPAAPQDVINYACKLLKVEPPPEIPYENANLSEMARSFYRDNKRVANTRLKQELGVSLSWPTYREGLESLLQ